MQPPAYEPPLGELHGWLNEAKTTAADDAHFENPGRTRDLRGVEANTDRSKGDPLAQQHGTADEHGSMVNTPDECESTPFRTYPITTVGGLDGSAA